MNFDTAWHAVAALVALAGLISTAISVYVGITVRATAQTMRAELADLRAEIARARSEDRDEMRDWINGSFMRSAQVHAELKAFDIRMDHAEARLKGVERRAA